eukprot:PLAT15325.1.p2 GENE.PLAT15325.1~~PLAT15325.1.p2  ORF type:complete len:357 (+),score=205.89 PLAT15325.1:145-1215(+)
MSFMMEAKVDDLERRLRERIEVMTGFADDEVMIAKLEEVFKYYDTDGTGKVEFDEFLDGMYKLNFVGVNREVRHLFDRYDADGSEALSYGEFSAGVLGLKPHPSSSPEGRSVVERVRALILERGGKNGIRTLGRILRTMDDSGDHALDKEELRTGLADYGLRLTPKELDKVFKLFDRDGGGKISFDELLVAIRGKLSPRRRRLVQKAFSQLDRAGDGKVTLEDAAVIYDVSESEDVIAGKMSEEEALEDFMQQWDTLEDDGVITEAEFLEYYRDVSASIDDDDYFELMIRNAWHISGGSGAYENTSNMRVLVTHADGSQTVEEVKNDLGLARDDIEGIKARLAEQGIDAVAISLAA